MLILLTDKYFVAAILRGPRFRADYLITFDQYALNLIIPALVVLGCFAGAIAASTVGYYVYAKLLKIVQRI